MPIDARDRAVRIMKEMLSIWKGSSFDRNDLQNCVRKHAGITSATYQNYVTFFKSKKWIVEKDFKFKIDREIFERDAK